MELDEFKQRLKEHQPQPVASRSAHELTGYIHRRATSTIKKIKRNILFELVACIAFIFISVWMYIVYQIFYVRAFAVLSVILCFMLMVYLISLHRKISAYEKDTFTVRLGLQLVIEIIQQFTRLYFRFTMITLPIAFVFGIIGGFLHLNGTLHNISSFNWQRSILFYTVLFITWSVIIQFFSKWYIKKLYGNYLQQLKAQLRDIENG